MLLRIVLVFFTLGITFTALKAQNKSSVDKGIKTILCGMLSPSFPDSLKKITLQIIDPALLEVYYTNRRIVQCDVSDRRFKFEFNVENPVYLVPGNFATGELPIFDLTRSSLFLDGRYANMLIEPGDSIYMQLQDDYAFVNTQNERMVLPGYETIKFSGRGAEKQWCVQSLIGSAKVYRDTRSKSTFLNVKLKDSIAYMVKSIIRLYRSKLSKAASKILAEDFIRILLPDISEVVTGEVLKNTSSITPYKVMDLQNLKLREMYRKKLKESRFYQNPSDPDLIYTSKFYYRIEMKRAYVQYCMDKGYSSLDSVAYLSIKEKYLVLNKYIPAGPLKEKILANFIAVSGFQNKGLNSGNQNLVKKFIFEHPRSLFSVQLQKLNSEYEKDLAIGSPAFEFNLPDTLGNYYKMSDFKGKVVVIDFMFTFCPGCAQMVPKLKLVEERYKGNDKVVFISISVDNNNNWKNSNGVQYAVPGNLYLYTEGLGFNHPLIKHYKISTYPKLVLIDKEGKLISSGAPDPRLNELALTQLIESEISKTSDKIVNINK